MVIEDGAEGIGMRVERMSDRDEVRQRHVRTVKAAVSGSEGRTTIAVVGDEHGEARL